MPTGCPPDPGTASRAAAMHRRCGTRGCGGGSAGSSSARWSFDIPTTTPSCWSAAGRRSRWTRSVFEAVTYDFWETIAREAHESLMERRTRAWSELLRDSEVPPETVRRTFEETWRIHSEHWRDGRQFSPVMAAERAVEDLGVAVSPRLREDLLDAFADAGATAELIVNDGLEDTLAELTRRGVRIGIICDVGFTSGELLRGFLERRRLL